MPSSEGGNEKRRKEKAKGDPYKRLRKRGNGNKMKEMVLVREMKDCVITVVKESFRNVVDEYNKQANMDLMNAMKSELKAKLCNGQH
ncbi:hypothetical protein SUGI_0146710 [Cryptomeria japonica]|nr:hypothetical protein SUGI_0146660 [Cryptomeria japonica]GLJ11212.1 hypothetical protein SUGI_0146710 [Cryptomeria japonica]